MLLFLIPAILSIIISFKKGHYKYTIGMIIWTIAGGIPAILYTRFGFLAIPAFILMGIAISFEKIEQADNNAPNKTTGQDEITQKTIKYTEKRISYFEKLETAYKRFNPETVGMLFPGGINQADKIVTSLGRIYNINLENCNSEKYYEILSTYLHIFVRKTGTHSSDEHIINTLVSKYSDLVKTNETAQEALSYVVKNMQNFDFVIDSIADKSMINDTKPLSSLTLEETKENANRADEEKIYVDITDYKGTWDSELELPELSHYKTVKEKED